MLKNDKMVLFKINLKNFVCRKYFCVERKRMKLVIFSKLSRCIGKNSVNVCAPDTFGEEAERDVLLSMWSERVSI